MTCKLSTLFWFAIGLCLAAFLPFWYFSSTTLGLLAAIVGAMVFILVVEAAFRIAYFRKHEKPYEMIPKVPFEKICVEPHPYLPYVMKKNANNLLTGLTPFPLNKDKGFKTDKFSTNSMGHSNGPDGTREVTIPKPEGVFRIHCLGASTTHNYIYFDGSSYSYPLELEKILQKRFPDKKIEVNNSGVGGYTSIEVLIQFLLTIIDAEPDMVVLYHSCNDIMASLTPGFKSDYSHAKRNLAEEYNKYKTLSKIPYIPLAFYNHAFFPEMVHSLLDAVCRGKTDTNIDFQGEQTYRRNIEHLIHICKANDIKIVLSTFCRYLYKEIEDDPGFHKLHEGISRENVIMSELAEKYSLPLVDSNNLIPREEKYFIDHVHFSPLGMEILAQHISVPIIHHISQLEECSNLQFP